MPWGPVPVDVAEWMGMVDARLDNISVPDGATAVPEDLDYFWETLDL